MNALSAAGLLIAGQVSDILLRTGRAIDMIIPQCTIEEHARDELVITEHPIQHGAAITDHAYQKPTVITARYAWSNSGMLFNWTTGGIAPSDPAHTYERLLQLQASRKPFILQTGKRHYKNTLIQTIEQSTDDTSEHALMVSLTFRQIILVEVQETQLKASVQKYPQQTAPVINKGTVQPRPSQSVLNITFGG
jgi:hypothetical protein